jgi:hypothetical protein
VQRQRSYAGEQREFADRHQSERGHRLDTDPDISKQWEALGAVPLYSPPKAFDETIRSDAERYAKLFNSAGEHFPETGSPVFPDEHRSGAGNQASYDPALDLASRAGRPAYLVFRAAGAFSGKLAHHHRDRAAWQSRS